MSESSSASPAQTRAPAAKTSNSKETIEQIIVALILAFIFRAFIVEAFVIPTGSMATTLLGAHMRYDCHDCGYRFDVNYDAHGEGEDLVIPRRAGRTYTLFCPNCGYEVPQDEATNPEVHYGDRILVLKHAYLLQQPQRWDVVVFKSPADPVHQQNFIKRLVGLPGETIMILDGGIYVRGADQDLWQVQPKPRHVQERLWRIVYDNDHYPQQLQRYRTDPWIQPWTETPGGQGWDTGGDAAGGRVFRFNNLDGSSTLWFDAEANANTHGFTDWATYNPGPTGPRNVISDLKLSLFYHRTAGTGPLQLQLIRRDDVFTAEIRPDQVRLLLHRKGEAEPRVLQSLLLEVPARAQVEFMNVDYQVTLRIDGQDVIRTTSEQYSPDVQALLREHQARIQPPKPQVRIIGDRQVCSISHLSLWRDIYYTNEHFEGPLRWASPTGFPNRLIHLGPDEYFVLGDNSPVSADARYWNRDINRPHEMLYVQAGRVPERFMLGKAFFVYWPAGYRPVPQAPALVPNFGSMRMIH